MSLLTPRGAGSERSQSGQGRTQEEAVAAANGRTQVPQARVASPWLLHGL